MKGKGARGRGSRIFLLAAAAGAAIAIASPKEWSNLAQTPGLVVWIFGPAYLVYAALCIVNLTDFVSNSGGNPLWLATLWVISVAVVLGLYGAGFHALIRLAADFRKKAG